MKQAPQFEALKTKIAAYLATHEPTMAPVAGLLEAELDAAWQEKLYWRSNPRELVHVALDRLAHKLFGPGNLADGLETHLFGAPVNKLLLHAAASAAA